jgi:hypothetical protein
MNLLKNIVVWTLFLAPITVFSQKIRLKTEWIKYNKDSSARKESTISFDTSGRISVIHYYFAYGNSIDSFFYNSNGRTVKGYRDQPNINSITMEEYNTAGEKIKTQTISHYSDDKTGYDFQYSIFSYKYNSIKNKKIETEILKSIFRFANQKDTSIVRQKRYYIYDNSKNIIEYQNEYKNEKHTLHYNDKHQVTLESWIRGQDTLNKTSYLYNANDSLSEIIETLSENYERESMDGAGVYKTIFNYENNLLSESINYFNESIRGRIQYKYLQSKDISESKMIYYYENKIGTTLYYYTYEYY